MIASFLADLRIIELAETHLLTGWSYPKSALLFHRGNTRLMLYGSQCTWTLENFLSGFLFTSRPVLSPEKWRGMRFTDRLRSCLPRQWAIHAFPCGLRCRPLFQTVLGDCLLFRTIWNCGEAQKSPGMRHHVQGMEANVPARSPSNRDHRNIHACVDCSSDGTDACSVQHGSSRVRTVP